MEKENLNPLEMNEGQENSESVRRSAREQKLTEKGRSYKKELLLQAFHSEHCGLLDFLTDTDSLLQQSTVDCEDMISRRQAITSRISLLRETAEKINELDDGEESTDGLLNDVANMAVSTMNKIVTATKHMNDPVRSVVSHASKRSKASSTSSQRLLAAAEAAALQAKLQSQRLEKERQEKLEQLEFEENLRRMETERTMAKMKREIEEEKIVAQLKMEEARLKVLDEPNSGSQSSQGSHTAPQRQDIMPHRRALHQIDDWNNIMPHRQASHQIYDCAQKTNLRHDTQDLHQFDGRSQKTNLRHDAQALRQIGDRSQGTNLRHEAQALHQSDTHAQRTNLNYDAPVFTPWSQTTEQFADALARAITTSRLPIPEPPIFTGDPLHYPDWIFSFTSLIENRGIAPSDKIHYLKRYLGGPAREAVSGFFMLRSDDAYRQARDILEKRFGNPFAVSEAFRTKLDAWPKVANKDKAGLRNLSDFLLQCQAAAAEVPDLKILDDVREIRKITAKLPDWIAHRWNRTTATTKRDKARYPTFQEFTQFVVEESEIVNDPVLSAEPLPAGPRPQSQRHHEQPRPPKTVLNTNGNMVSNNHNENTQTSASSTSCLFCKRQHHSMNECRDFMRKQMPERKDFVRKEGLCFGCLRPGHMSKDCTKRCDCKKCSKKHPTSLHDDNWSSNHQRPPKEMKRDDQKDTQQTDLKNGSCRKVLSNTESSLTSMAVPVFLSTDENPHQEILVYALLDTMSDSTFVLESVARDLQASSTPAALKLTTMTDTSVTVACQKYSNLRVRGFNSEKTIHLPVTYSRDHIPLDDEHIPSPETAGRWPHLSRLENVLVPKQDCAVGLLIGYNCPRALAPLNCVTGDDDQPYAVETELGWSIVGGITESFDAIGTSHRVITGEVAHSAYHPERSVTYVQKTHIKEVTTADLVKIMEQDFQELSPPDQTMSQEDKQFLKTLEEGIHQTEDGHYEMPLPFRNGEPKLPNNRQAAYHRVMALKRQFERKPQYLQHYTAFMKEIIDRGDAEKVPSDEMNDTQWYIPHHGVYHPKKPEKVRVVFDCSARYQGTCINDHLLQGPDLVNSLVGVLCRFRQGPIAFTCDVEKMYHQFRVERRHQDYLRFLWWEDGDLSKAPVDYRMKVHLFGASSSPGCANFALKRLAKDHEHLGERAANFLMNDFYVDDGLKGESTAEAAIDLLEKARLICSKGGLRLHKIVSNSNEVVNSVPESERGGAAQANKNTDLGTTALESVLGLQWCMESDSFCFKLNPKDNPLTRRGILATVASIYDPLGLIAPVVLVGRMILQEMCGGGAGWDHPIPEDLRPQWEKWMSDLQKLTDFKVPRCYLGNISSPVGVELHHFSDASLQGYGQCSYLRLRSDDGQAHCTLVMAKARVAPLKATTVPRLELQAAVLSAKTAAFLDAELDYPNITNFFWTDSKVVLGYIKNKTTRFHMYVANRVEQICQRSNPDQWHYIATSENPADHASRGLSVDELSTSNWLKGPDFLWQREITMNDADIEVDPQDKEIKSATVHTTQGAKFTTFEERIRRFSSLRRAVTAVARIVMCCARKRGKEISDVEAKKRAEQNIVKCIQRESFDVSDLKSKSSPLSQLDPFLDEDGLLRVGGRIKKTSELYGVKHPLILPKNSHVSHLITAHQHEKTAHQGRSLTINAIRSAGYWILGCRRVVSSLINKCTACIRHRGKAKGQKMADLPKERVEPSPPFTYCGIDCFGPFTVKEGRKEVKRYGLLITCLAMRAVHIEVLDDMTTDAFLNGLRCFIALRGKVRMIRCDQGSNFIGAKHELKEELKKLDHKTVALRLLELDCEFKFNPPSSSHMGGIWERQIRNIRNVLTGILDNCAARLDTSCLRTLMYEAMAIVNSRPLTVENLERADGPLPLTPNHVLTMKPGIVMPPPPGVFEKEDLYLKKRWRRVQYLADTFWTRWKKEYLQTLQTRSIWQQTQDNIREGDIVLLQEDGICRTDWKTARVVKTFPGDDGRVRRVKLLMATSELDKHGKPLRQRSYLERPVHKLIVLLPKNISNND